MAMMPGFHPGRGGSIPPSRSKFLQEYYYLFSKVWRASVLSLTIYLSGCFGPGSMKELSEKYETVWGRLVAPPKITDHRIFLYVQKAPEEGQSEGLVLVCVAENLEKDEILKNLAVSVVESDKPLYILGNKVKGHWNEYMDGVDFEVVAVGYFNPAAQKYQTVITTFGTKLSDMVRSVSWGDFIQMMGKKAVDTAM